MARGPIRTRCKSSTRVTAALLLSFLALPQAVTTDLPPQLPLGPTGPAIRPVHDFTLRHIFHRGTYKDPQLHKKLNVRPQETLWSSSEDELPQVTLYPHFVARSQGLQIQRLADRTPALVDSYLHNARTNGQPVILDASQWTLDDVNGPNIEDKDTIVNLAVMAANAYAPVVGEGEWEDVRLGYNYSQSFGWQGDGLRGHIFADEGNSTVVISLKGTSPAVFDGDGTTTKDKLNDNLFFSCCCAQGGQYFWRQVCNCYKSTYTCNQTCLTKALKNENRYYRAAIDLYTNVTELYPDSYVWVVGHSLGGSVSSLLGLTFGLPVVTYEAPGEALAAARLGLPSPPGVDPTRPQERKYSGIVHVGHTADPVFMGTCNGATATCTLGGYAMESQCHAGIQCVYDTVEDFGWRVGIGNHKIRNVIDNVLRKYDTVPKCIPDDECKDCFLWKYFESNGSDTTTTSTKTTSSTSRTRTSTCKTPGWWGCLDETTTTTKKTTTTSDTKTSPTCETPGWFGCKDPITQSWTQSATLAPSPGLSSTTQPAETSSCSHPGWFGGCRDTTSGRTSGHHTMSGSPTSSECKTPGYFLGCRDDNHRHSLSITPPITTASTSVSTSLSPTSTQSEGERCRRWIFFGLFCWDDQDGGTATSSSSTSPSAGSVAVSDSNSEL